HDVSAIVSSGEDAVAAVEKMAPDLVLMDIVLKGKMDGIEAAKYIRKSFEIPVVYLTAYSDEKTLKRAKKTEPFGYIMKPYHEQDLKTTIEMALYKHTAEKRHREQKNLLRAVIDGISDPILLADKKCRIVLCNAAFLKLLNLSMEEVLGKYCFDMWHDESLKRKKCHLKKVFTTKKPTHVEKEHISPDGTHRYFDLYEYPVFDESGNVIYVVEATRDITEEKRAEQRILHLNGVLRSIRNVNQLIARERDSKKLLQEACKILTKVRDYRLAWIGTISETHKRVIPVAFYGIEAGYLDSVVITWDDSSTGKGPTGRAIKEHRSIVSQNIQADRRFKPWRAEALKRGYHSSAAVPMISEGKLYGVLNIYSSEPKAFNGEEIGLLEEVATDLALALRTMHIESEQKHAHQAIQESEERYRALVEFLPIGIEVYVDNKIAYANPYAVKLMGAGSQDELIGKSFLDFVHPDSQQLVKNRVKEIKPLVKLPIVEEKIINLNGDILDIEVTSIKIPYKNSYGILAAFSDITERKRIEEALRENEERFRILFQTSPDAISVNRLKDGIYQAVNDAFVNLTGYTAEEVYEKSVIDLHFWVNDSDRKRFIEEIISSGEAKNLVTPFRIKDGSVRMGLVSAKKIILDGSPHIISFARDITEWERAGEQINRLASVIEQASETVVITDLDGNIQYVNPAFEKTTGYSVSEALGQNPRILQSGQHDKAFYQELWAVITAGKTWQGVFVNKRKDGKLFYENAIIFPIKDSAGKIINFAAVKRDITAERELEEQLRQSQKLEAIGQLAGGVAHDFNNLLTAINGYSEMILMDLDENDPTRNDVYEILKAGKRAAELTKQLLTFSRKQVIQPQTLNINTIILNYYRMLRRLIGEDISLELALDEHVSPIRADSGQLEQILANLVLNARDAIHEKGSDTATRKITIETANVFLNESYMKDHVGSRVGQQVLIAVSDSGIGMKQKTIAKIFDPFFTTKGVGKGTGLGLSTVYGIVKQNGASIFVYSELGEGASFKIYWPSVSDTIEKKIPEHIENISLEGTETILIVEDESEVRNFAQKGLEKLKYHIFTARNGIEALEWIQKEHPSIDLLFTDVIMPGMDGKELSDRLAKILPDLKILFASGYANNHIAHWGVLDKDVNFINKPYSITDVAYKIRKILDINKTKK
ncbi:MAG TPA: PAS domain S-box protein, partial [Bacteroidetes bacterium]|nr:PAS domain S-box protein [Bacteroidota bacterium]